MLKCIPVLSLLFAALLCWGQTNRLEMPDCASPFTAKNFQVINTIPAHRWGKLPKEMAVFKYSNRPSEFPLATIQMLLKESGFPGGTMALQAAVTNDSPYVSKMLLRGGIQSDFFAVDPQKGSIILNSQFEQSNSRETPPADAVPAFETVQKQLLQWGAALGVQLDGISRNTNGNMLVFKAEGQTSRLGGAIKYKNRRSCMMLRCLAGYHMRSSDDDKISLELGINGRWLRFQMKWPEIIPVRTNKIISAEEVVQAIQTGHALADNVNEYPRQGIALVEIIDFEIEYYVPTVATPARFNSISQAEIIPILSIHTNFKSKTGETEDGGLFVPLLK